MLGMCGSVHLMQGDHVLVSGVACKIHQVAFLALDRKRFVSVLILNIKPFDRACSMQTKGCSTLNIKFWQIANPMETKGCKFCYYYYY